MTITNGDFEEGDLTGWVPSVSGTATIKVTESSKQTGTYGTEFYTVALNGETAFLTQSVDVTGFATLSVSFNVATYFVDVFDDSKVMIRASLDGDAFVDETYTLADPPPVGWQTATYDVSALSGSLDLELYTKSQDSMS